MKTQKYPSKISFGMVALLVLAIFSPLIFEFFLGANKKEMIELFLLLLGAFALMAHLFFTTRYEIDGENLKIKVSLFSYPSIPINSIRGISETRSILSAPAASFDRIVIKYGKFDEAIISPKDKIGFINHLKEINPKIEIKPSAT